MKKGLKKALLGIGLSVMTLGTSALAGCNPVEGVKSWVDQIFCPHETKEIVEAVAPTCTEDGYTEYEKCTNCGKEVTKGAKIEATGHTIEVTKGYAATCTTMGLTDKKTCTVCEEVIEEAKTIPALGHKKKEVKAVAATCTEDGHTAGVICENGCGTIYSGYEIIPAGHTYENDLCKVCGAGISAADLKVGVDYTGYTVRPKYDYDYVENLLNEGSVPSGELFLNFSEKEDLYVTVYFSATSGVSDEGDLIDVESEPYIVIDFCLDNENYSWCESITWRKGEENISFTLGEFYEEGVDINGSESNAWVYSSFESGVIYGTDDSKYTAEQLAFILDLIEFVPPTPVEAAV